VYPIWKSLPVAPRSPAALARRWARLGLSAALICVAGIAHAQAEPAAPDTGISFIAPDIPIAAEDSAGIMPAPPESLVAWIPPDPTPPAQLHDLDEWLDFKQRNQINALPNEARIFYRRGVMAEQSGSRAEAMRLVRGASALDPTFIDPRITLAMWLLLREPGPAFAQFASVVEVARQSFAVQLSLKANALFALLQAILLGLIATAVLIAVVRGQELRHRWQEVLAERVSRPSAIIWSWVMFCVPFALGLGPALPAVVFLGLLWPMLRWGERTVFILLTISLGAMPWCIQEFDRLGSPLREDREPLFGILRVQNEPFSLALAERVNLAAAEHPDNGFVQFAQGWVLRRGGDLVGAESAYRRALAAWPDDARVLNNLGNVLGLLGRSDEAIDALTRASQSDPTQGAPHYNRARLFTERYEFAAAEEATARANALNFELMNPGALRSRQVMMPADLWLAPSRLRRALDAYQAPAGAMLAIPPAWRTRIECSGWPFSILAVIAAIASVVGGFYAHRKMPVRLCGNCQRVICRRCARRRREVALCRECFEAASRSGSAEFVDVLLLDRQRYLQRRRRAWRAALAATVPALGLILHRRSFRALALCIATAALATITAGVALPFAYEPRIEYPRVGAGMVLLVLPWAAVYALSILGYFSEAQRERAQIEQRLAAARRSRPSRSAEEAA
jgi:tetratricopeptide (TPR) repeat protein